MPQAEKARKSLGWAAVRGAKRWSREQGEWVVSEWRGSGQSVQSFATEHGIDPQRVYFWSKRSKPQRKGKRGQHGRPEIVKLKLGPSALGMDRRVEIQLVSGRRMSVAERIDLDLLEQLVGQRVQSSTDLEELRHWIRRAAVITSADELFDE